MRTIVAGILLFSVATWGCSCDGSEPLCKGVAIETGPGVKIFVGRAVSLFKWSPRYGYSFEERKRALLEEWGSLLSAESRESIRTAVEDKNAWGVLDYSGIALSRIQVVEPFSGATQGEVVELFGGFGGGDCSFPLQPGASYLVFAYRWKGFWSTSICTRTQKLDGPNDDLEVLRARRDGRPAPRLIYGRLTDQTPRGDWSRLSKMEDFPVRLLGPDETRGQVTDRRGSFRFDNLRPGSYRLETTAPGWSLLSGHEAIAVKEGCTQVTANLVEKQSSLSGRAEATAPAPFTLEGATMQYERTRMPSGVIGTDGSFRLANIEPGDYRVVINPLNTPGPGLLYPVWFYPGVATRDRAEVVHIERGKDVVLPAVWTLPAPFVEKRIEGAFLLPDGRPVGDVGFFARDLESGHELAAERSAADGRAEIRVIEGRPYRIEAPGYAGSVVIGPEFSGKFIFRVVR